MSESLYLLSRLAPTTGVAFGTIYDHNESATYTPARMVESMMAVSNVEYLTDLIIARADPSRSVIPNGIRAIVVAKVKEFLTSWRALGKFEFHYILINGNKHVVSSISPVALKDHYNTEFVEEFAEKILPMSQATNVRSVTNPNGMYAQQERIIKMTAKPVPFYERALYRRLNDWTVDLPVDETQNPFYRMDHNPRLSKKERKKTDLDKTPVITPLDRESLSYRMIPNYSTKQ